MSPQYTTQKLPLPSSPAICLMLFGVIYVRGRHAFGSLLAASEIHPQPSNPVDIRIGRIEAQVVQCLSINRIPSIKGSTKSFRLNEHICVFCSILQLFQLMINQFLILSINDQSIFLILKFMINPFSSLANTDHTIL